MAEIETRVKIAVGIDRRVTKMKVETGEILEMIDTVETIEMIEEMIEMKEESIGMIGEVVETMKEEVVVEAMTGEVVTGIGIKIKIMRITQNYSLEVSSQGILKERLRKYLRSMVKLQT